jgi:hypothetical protein
LRIVKGTAVYTENFTVPSAPLAGASPEPAPVELLGDVTVSDIFSGQSISSAHSSGGIEVYRGSTSEGMVIELDVQSGQTYELQYFGGVGPHPVPNKSQNNQMWVATVPSGRSIPTNIMDKSNYNILKRENGSFGTVFIDTSLQPFSDPNNVENGLLAVWSTTGTFTVPEDISKVHLIFFDGNTDNTGHYVKTISVKATS